MKRLILIALLLTLSCFSSSGQKPFDVILCPDTCVIIPAEALKWCNKQASEVYILRNQTDTLTNLLNDALQQIDNYAVYVEWKEKEVEVLKSQVQSYYNRMNEQKKKVRLWQGVSGGVFILLIFSLL
jgi:hypothetical protein